MSPRTQVRCYLSSNAMMRVRKTKHLERTYQICKWEGICAPDLEVKILQLFAIQTVSHSEIHVKYGPRRVLK